MRPPAANSPPRPRRLYVVAGSSSRSASTRRNSWTFPLTTLASAIPCEASARRLLVQRGVHDHRQVLRCSRLEAPHRLRALGVHEREVEYDDVGLIDERQCALHRARRAERRHAPVELHRHGKTRGSAAMVVDDQHLLHGRPNRSERRWRISLGMASSFSRAAFPRPVPALRSQTTVMSGTPAPTASAPSQECCYSKTTRSST